MTNHADLINGLFELVGGLMIMADVYRLHKDKMLRGVYWPVRAFFLTWGLWNLYFYPFYEAWLSFVGGIVIAVANVAWCILAIKYRRN